MDDDLRRELLRRADADQLARAALDRADDAGDDPTAALDTMTEVDADNTAWLRALVETSGWPAASRVGREGARAAWLLVQHADADPTLQRRCLELLSDAVRRGEGDAVDLAYLTDRVLLRFGGHQEFGTQLRATADGWVPRRLRDRATVDARRATVGLEPLAAATARMTAEHPARPSTLVCGSCGGAVAFWHPEPGHPVDAVCPTCGTTITVGGDGDGVGAEG
jgi:hypothetical protein